MTAMPRDVARKQPANTPVRRQPAVIEGRFKAARHGPTLPGVLTGFALVLLTALMAGLMLALITP